MALNSVEFEFMQKIFFTWTNFSRTFGWNLWMEPLEWSLWNGAFMDRGWILGEALKDHGRILEFSWIMDGS